MVVLDETLLTQDVAGGAEGLVKLAPEHDAELADGCDDGPFVPVVVTFLTQGLNAFSYQL